MTDNILNLNNLVEKYKITLSDYEKKTKELTEYGNMNNKDDKNVYLQLQNRVWWGSSPVSENNVQSINECQTLCSDKYNCSGATYNSKNKKCYLSSGDGNIGNGNDYEYAIITKYKNTYLELKYLNGELIYITNQINDLLKNSTSEFENLEKQNIEELSILNENYDKLLNQQKELNNLLYEHKTINEELFTSDVLVSSNYVKYKLWTFLTFIIIILSIKELMGIQTNNAFFVILFIFIILIILSYMLQSAVGYFILSLFIGLIILMSRK